MSLLLVGLALAIYWPVRGFDFVRIDDPDYVWSNPIIQKGLTAEGFAWAFTTGHTGNWHPLSWLSHMADVELFGIAPPGQGQLGHHLVSVVFHAVNAVLLMLALWMMTRSFWPSAAVALLFVVHPVRVESVAWVAERKDVLSAFFGLLAIIAYVRWAQRGPSSRWLAYFAMLLCFAMSLLAKPMFVTLPCLLLLLDVWPLRRIDLGSLFNREPRDGRLVVRQCVARVLEKLPLLLLALASSVITYIVQDRVGAVAVLERLSLANRAGNAVVSYMRYIGKTIWPTDLVLQYPHPMAWPAEIVVVCGAAVAGITALGAWQFRTRPWILIGWLWFVGTLMPVIGLVQVGSQSMADRYLYFPQVGLLIAIVWTVASLCVGRAGRIVGAAGLTICVVVLAVIARAQVMVWRNTETLCLHAINKTPNNWLMQHLLGLTYLHQKRTDLAARQFAIAAQLNPGHAEISSNLGDMYALQGQYAQALEAYRRALDLEPDREGTLNNMAVILATADDPALRDGRTAVRLAQRACELTDYKHPGNLFTLAAAWAEAGSFDQAVRLAEQARALAVETRQASLVADIDQKLELFRAGKPSRQMFVDPDGAR